MERNAEKQETPGIATNQSPDKQLDTVAFRPPSVTKTVVFLVFVFGTPQKTASFVAAHPKGCPAELPHRYHIFFASLSSSSVIFLDA